MGDIDNKKDIGIIYDIYEKALRVIESCENNKHIDAGYQYVKLFNKAVKHFEGDDLSHFDYYRTERRKMLKELSKTLELIMEDKASEIMWKI